MKPINIEKLMNHSIGISYSYYLAIEQELLEDYLKAVDTLSINDDRLALQKQVPELTEKSRGELYHTGLKEKYDADIALLKEAIADMQQLLKNPESCFADDGGTHRGFNMAIDNECFNQTGR